MLIRVPLWFWQHTIWGGSGSLCWKGTRNQFNDFLVSFPWTNLPFFDEQTLLESAVIQIVCDAPLQYFSFCFTYLPLINISTSFPNFQMFAVLEHFRKFLAIPKMLSLLITFSSSQVILLVNRIIKYTQQILNSNRFQSLTVWSRIPTNISHLLEFQKCQAVSYCSWIKSCTTKDDDYPIIYSVLTIPGAGFLPSTVIQDPKTCQWSQPSQGCCCTAISLHHHGRNGFPLAVRQRFFRLVVWKSDRHSIWKT